MTIDNPTAFTPNLVIGIGIALLGIVLILDRIGMVAAQDVLRFWPVLLIVFGASVVAQALRGGVGQPRSRPIVSPGFVFFIAIGALLFSHTYQRAGNAQGDTSGETTSQFNVMSKSYRTSTSTRFRGAELTSVMGTASLDLREAMIAPGGEAVIDVFAVMGRVELIIPDGWTVELEAVPVMGAVRDRRFRSQLEIDDRRTPAAEASSAEAPVAQAAAPPRVVLRGFVVMGAVVVRS
jgi:hypothetical protein